MCLSSAPTPTPSVRQVSLHIKPPGGTAGRGRIFTPPKTQGQDLNQEVTDDGHLQLRGNV